MKTFKQYLLEQIDNKVAVIAYGRYNPPTIGHQKLIDTVSETALKNNADAIIAPSHTEDKVKNPLSYSEKEEILKQMSKSVNILDKGKTFISLLQYLQQQGYNKIIHVAGSDRIPEFEKVVETYNGKPDKKGIIPFSFNTYEFVSAGERDPDSEGVEGMSASKLRQLAVDGDLDKFKQGMSDLISDELKEKTYENIRSRIK
jgi:phosphopantetheine adenylyltransferase